MTTSWDRHEDAVRLRTNCLEWCLEGEEEGEIQEERRLRGHARVRTRGPGREEPEARLTEENKECQELLTLSQLELFLNSLLCTLEAFNR